MKKIRLIKKEKEKIINFLLSIINKKLRIIPTIAFLEKVANAK
jgi:hypothetical protein